MTKRLPPDSSISFAATGDSFITRRMPVGDPSFRRIASLVQTADARLTHLETVIRRDEGFPAAQSGGTWASSRPEVLADLRAYGFNLISWASNHTLDYSYGGLESTGRYLDEAGFIHAGAGATRAEAGAIRYLDTSAGRVAFIAATSTFPESWIAGDQRSDGPGRPGINPLRFSTVYHVPGNELASLKKIADATRINATHLNRTQEGFVLPEPEGIYRFGHHLFTESKNGKNGEVTHPHRGDLDRLLRSVMEASRQADAVVVSLHSHEEKSGNKHLPADILVQASRACVDAGAHAIVGHGPHVLRGIEIYKHRPIFYSLGNFIFQNESVPSQPSDFYEKYHLDSSLPASEVFAHRSGNGTRGLALDPKVWRSVIASWRMSGGELRELTLHPISLGFGEPSYRNGSPSLTSDPSALADIVSLSKPFGTTLKLGKSRAIWRLPE